ncbi:MAG: hypothetical protein ABJP48_08300 [Erythrobacter sp.]
MYSEEDINSAVASGALSIEAAESFRTHMSKRRELPRSSEENFRLINSFNDIFVSIGVVILLLAAGAIGQSIGSSFSSAEPALMAGAGLLVALTAWPLTEFFTRKRRMALPSIILLLAFVGGVFLTIFGLGVALVENGDSRTGAFMVSVAGLVAAGSAYIHWKRFMVPITVAAGAAAVAATAIALLAAIIDPDLMDGNMGLTFVFIAGLIVFAFAMRWDMSDRARTTRRSDVAFWLHLLAAPMIAHPVFAAMGVSDGSNIGIAAAGAVIAVYIVFGLIALAVDRRALLVSALAYVLIALTFLFREFGAVELNFALTALVIGSALLSLSAFWQPIRKTVISALPQDIRDKLPPTEDQGAIAAQPAAT